MNAPQNPSELLAALKAHRDQAEQMFKVYVYQLNSGKKLTPEQRRESEQKAREFRAKAAELDARVEQLE